ncbi:hypothetical protein [Methylobacterium oryzihabitans]|uniref:Uncharacterized protein n=1 Tax=Methylobacterium oryzihabitans TaxID=2499852 RepID=A0A3S2V1L4_9HYPH|nr:hypothetical protein [Methylobacterium oryzihabitans]RVU11984.1 hypothetical protein EOE48_28170 [Methylobacterium oryzihabitans]
MTGRIASAAFADLAANVFAALLLVLLLLLAASGRPSRPVDAVRDLGARPHAPLPAGARPAGSPDTGTGPGRLLGRIRPVLEAAAILGGVAAVLLIARFVPRTRIRYKT